jgi:hypothetical protein
MSLNIVFVNSTTMAQARNAGEVYKNDDADFHSIQSDAPHHSNPPDQPLRYIIRPSNLAKLD